MAYRLPDFNVLCNFWRFGNPVTNPPDDAIMGNFNWGRRTTNNDAIQIGTQTRIPSLYLLLPKTATVFGAYDTGGSPDTIEIPNGSGRYYTLMFWDYSALGFANMHITAVIAQGIISSTPTSGDILLEDGTDLLCEDGTPMLLE